MDGQPLSHHNLSACLLLCLWKVLPVVGGLSAGRLEDGTAGWSFEFTVKPGMEEQWAKVMDLGSTRDPNNAEQCNNDIVFGCQWSAHTPRRAVVAQE